LSSSVAKLKSKASANNQYVVGLDIGTEFVKALIAHIDEGKLEILGVGRAHQDLNDMQAGAVADIAAVVANCNAALSDAEQQAGLSVRTAVVGIAGELVKGTTITIRCTRTNAKTPIDINEMEHIISLVQKKA